MQSLADRGEKTEMARMKERKPYPVYSMKELQGGWDTALKRMTK